jgi:HlyD family secretion protein
MAHITHNNRCTQAPHPARLMGLLAISAAVLLTSACSDKAPAAWSGYAEGDYVYVSAPLAGQLQTVSVQAGQSVAPGAALFTLESESEQAARAEAAARLDAAQAQATNLDKGKRPDELAVSKAQLEQAQTNAALAQRELARQQGLVAKGFVSKAVLDNASTALHQAKARVEELTAALRVARLPARLEDRTAAQATAKAAQDVLLQSTWRADQKVQTAPVQALVTDVFYQPGEFVPAGQPVVSLLPPQNRKARFFVPETDLARLQLGQTVQLHCDGCAGAIPATISRIATQPEYTPPVIYSNLQRAKLVFMVEAKPDAAHAAQIKPGQPLEVTPGTNGTTGTIGTAP